MVFKLEILSIIGQKFLNQTMNKNKLNKEEPNKNDNNNEIKQNKTWLFHNYKLYKLVNLLAIENINEDSQK